MSDKFDLDTVEWLRDVQRVCLEPDDVLVVRIKEKLPRAAILHVKAGLKGIFPNNEVVVLDGNIEIGVISIGDSEDPDGSV